MKKVPLRRCVATGEQLTKKELLRIVKNKDGELFVDPTGKQNGRGAYLKKTKDALAIAKKKKSLSRALKCEVPEEFYLEIEKYIDE